MQDFIIFKGSKSNRSSSSIFGNSFFENSACGTWLRLLPFGSRVKVENHAAPSKLAGTDPHDELILIFIPTVVVYALGHLISSEEYEKFTIKSENASFNTLPKSLNPVDREFADEVFPITGCRSLR